MSLLLKRLSSSVWWEEERKDDVCYRESYWHVNYILVEKRQLRLLNGEHGEACV